MVSMRVDQRGVVVEQGASITVGRQCEAVGILAGQGDAARGVAAGDIEVVEREFGAVSVTQVQRVAVARDDHVPQQLFLPRAVFAGLDQAVVLARLGPQAMGLAAPHGLRGLACVQTQGVGVGGCHGSVGSRGWVGAASARSWRRQRS